MSGDYSRKIIDTNGNVIEEPFGVNATLSAGTVSENSTSLSSGGSKTFDIGQSGTERLDVRVDRSENYSVDYVIQDGSSNTQFTVELLASGSGERTASTTEVYPNAQIQINDKASSSGSFSMEAHQR